MSRNGTVVQSATLLWDRLRKVDYFGQSGPPVPQGPTLQQALLQGAPILPLVYGDSYIQPVTSGLARLVGLVRNGSIRTSSLEIVTGAIYQHGPDWPTGAPLRRFLAVVSNLYLSFLDSAKRSGAAIPLRQTLPPLAMFQHDGSSGPITIGEDLMEKVLGGKVGVVSMPATFADHPVLWSALAHETGGHDVTHADPGLLQELSDGLAPALAGLPGAGSMSIGDIAALWGYWIDEASADVYGLLNIGPSFGENLAIFLAAMNGGDAPRLRMECRSNPADPAAALDPHPADILRLHLALGAIDALAGLAPERRSFHTQRIEALAASLGTGQTLTLQGAIADERGRPVRLRATVPLAPMQQAARAVGNFIATAKLQALGGAGIQQVETWDDQDEADAQAVRAAMVAGGEVRGLGDAAHALAAATLAVLERPDQYDAITAALNTALDHNFRNDPVWGVPAPDPLYLRYGPAGTEDGG